MAIELKVNPYPKPRMTRSDKWKKRPCVEGYWLYKDRLRYLCKEAGYELKFPQKIPLSLTFVIPMPPSWPESKRVMMDGFRHEQTPDINNLIKAFEDCLLEEDKKVWWYGEMKKVWGRQGRIFIHEKN